MSADSNGRRAWLWGGAAALLLLLALMQLGSGPDPIVSRAELRRRQIYDAAEWAQRVPIELATSYVVRSKLREYVEELELPDEMRARLLARLDAPDFVDELVPFLIAVKGMYAPAEDEAASARRYARVPVRMSVRISTIEPERDPWTGRPFFRSIQESCANVSRGGAFVTTAEPLDPGKRVLVELRLPTGRELEAIGRVAWVKRVLEPRESEPESGVGIEFLCGGNQELAALEDYISNNLDE